MGTASEMWLAQTLTTETTRVVTAATRYQPGSAMIWTPEEGEKSSLSMGGALGLFVRLTAPVPPRSGKQHVSITRHTLFRATVQVEMNLSVRW